MKTTFEKVSELNIAFGNNKGDILNPDVKAIRKQAQLVLEEAIELMEAAYPGAKVFWQWDIGALPLERVPETVDMKEILDAQGDVTTVNDGMAHIAGFNGNQVLAIVDDSNRTKFIPDQESVAPALQYYYDLGFEPHQLYIHGEFPLACIKVSEDCVVAGKKYPAGKFLKNMATFKEPDFSLVLCDLAPSVNLISLDSETDGERFAGHTIYGDQKFFDTLYENFKPKGLTNMAYSAKGELIYSELYGEFTHGTLENGLSGDWISPNNVITQYDLDHVNDDYSAIGVHSESIFSRF